jgi:hypothetical protein
MAKMQDHYDECLKTLQGHNLNEIDSGDFEARGACRTECSDCRSERRICHKEAVGINAVSATPPGRKAAMKFHLAAVQRPLSSAVKVVQAGNRVVLAREGAYIQSDFTGEKMPLRVERGTFVFDVEYADGSPGTITLDSGAGVNMWPEHLLPALPMSPPEQGLRMTAE